MPAWESGESNLTSRASLQGSRPARELQSTWLPLREAALHGISIAGNVVRESVMSGGLLRVGLWREACKCLHGKVGKAI